VLRRPIGEALRIELLEIAASRIGHGHDIAPDMDRRRLGLPFLEGQPLDGAAHIVAHQVDDRIDIDAARHMAHEKDQRADTAEGQRDADGEREMRDEFALARGPHAAQDHQGIGEGAEEDAQRHLVPAVAGEVAQQARAHLPGGERQRGDGDGEDRARSADGGGGDGAEQRPRAGGTTAIEPGTGDQRLGDCAAAVQPDEAEGERHAAGRQQARQNPEGVVQCAEQFSEAGVHRASDTISGRRGPMPLACLPNGPAHSSSVAPGPAADNIHLKEAAGP
jgi:hypothetical protein